jgi:hypothetical protein
MKDVSPFAGAPFDIIRMRSEDGGLRLLAGSLLDPF